MGLVFLLEPSDPLVMGSVTVASTDLFLGFLFLGALIVSFLSSLGMEGSTSPDKMVAKFVASFEVRLLAAFCEVV